MTDRDARTDRSAKILSPSRCRLAVSEQKRLSSIDTILIHAVGGGWDGNTSSTHESLRDPIDPIVESNCSLLSHGDGRFPRHRHATGASPLARAAEEFRNPKLHPCTPTEWARWHHGSVRPALDRLARDPIIDSSRRDSRVQDCVESVCGARETAQEATVAALCSTRSAAIRILYSFAQQGRGSMTAGERRDLAELGYHNNLAEGISRIDPKDWRRINGSVFDADDDDRFFTLEAGLDSLSELVVRQCSRTAKPPQWIVSLAREGEQRFSDGCDSARSWLSLVQEFARQQLHVVSPPLLLPERLAATVMQEELELDSLPWQLGTRAAEWSYVNDDRTALSFLPFGGSRVFSKVGFVHVTAQDVIADLSGVGARFQAMTGRAVELLATLSHAGGLSRHLPKFFRERILSTEPTTDVPPRKPCRVVDRGESSDLERDCEARQSLIASSSEESPALSSNVQPTE